MELFGGLTTEILTAIFIILKLTNLVAWAWVWVLSPLWIDAIISIILSLIMTIIFFRMFK